MEHDDAVEAVCRIRERTMTPTISLPATFDGIGYTRSGGGLPLEAISVELPKPGPDQVLIHAFWSSLNPLEYKLTQLNFMGR
jgi:hypothetical protein